MNLSYPHVSFGIAMALIAIFHFLWHIKYYFSPGSKQARVSGEVELPFPSDGKSFHISSFLLLLGMITIINQLIFIREFISIFSGNELIIGIVLAIWLFITATGAIHARQFPLTEFSLHKLETALFFTSAVPLISISLLYWFKSQLFPPGTAVGLGISIVGTVILLLPVCFLSGFLFVRFTSLIATPGKTENINKAYSFESIGSLLGGLLFSVVLGRYFNSLQILGLTAASTGLIIFFLNQKKRNWLWLLSLLIPVILFTTKPYIYLNQLLYPNQKIVLSKSSRYGHLLITSQAGQKNYYQDNELLFYSDNVAECEEAVHFAMLQRESTKKVLLLSGGLAGMINEIKKYQVDKITYLETNPEMFARFSNETAPIKNDHRVEIVKTDIRSFLLTNNERYDVILMNLPPPSSLAYNRFFSMEFFELLKNHCKQETVIGTSLPSTINYAGEEALRVNASLWNTIGKVFTNQLLVMGEKNYFLASNSALSPQITELVSQRAIQNKYVNRYFMNDSLQITRSQTLIARFNGSTPVNHDFKPYLFFNQINHWLSLWKINYWLVIIIILAVFLFNLTKLNVVSFGLYTGGFSSSSLEMILLIAYQLYFGTVYIAASLFFTLFMGGLAAGSYFSVRKGPVTKRNFITIQMCLASFAVILFVVISSLNHFTLHRMLIQTLFFIFTFLLAFLVGTEYRLASQLQSKGAAVTASLNYSSDLLGSSLGALLTTLLLIPLLGIDSSCFIIAGLNLVSAAVAYFFQRN